MIVCNITTKIAPEIESKWLAWQRQEHIPGVMASGCFTEYKLYKLLEQDESDGITYVLQFFASSVESYNQYVNEIAPLLSKKSIEKWGNKYIAFRSTMQVVN